MEKGRYSFRVRSYECGPDGRATLPTICNYLQEAASLNAATLGFGKGDFAVKGENVSWVLTRMVVKMSRYPVWNDEVTVETFPRGGRRIVAWRDFEVKDAQGATLGLATTEWMLIDLASRKIVAVPEKVFAANDPANIPVLGLEPFSKFRIPESGGEKPPSQVPQFCGGGTPPPQAPQFCGVGTLPPQAPQFCGAGASRPRNEMTFTAMKSQIDLNGHVNNVHYIDWMLEPCESRCPAEMEIVFRSETFAGDEVRVETAAADGFTYHRVFAPDGKDHIVARTRQRA